LDGFPVLIGAHESVQGGLSLAFERAVEHRAKSIQIFTKSARGWAAPPLSEESLRAFRAASRRARLPAMAHGSYLTNLAAEEPTLRAKSIECLWDEFSRCERLGIESLVIHPGCHSDEKRGIHLICSALDEIHSRKRRARTRICLESTAGQGNAIGWRFEQLSDILSGVKQPERLGICLDTCHLFAAGYDLSTRRGYESAFTAFDRLVGLPKLRCFHLNDCKKPLGCRVDRHEEIGRGTLGLKPFRWLVNDPRFAQVPAVLETPFQERYGKAIELLESLVDR
jgi:deoxyribonuclease-4